MQPQMNRSFRYDICLSYAGEDRAYVKQVADALHGLGLRVFYDEFEKAGLWGKDLYTHLDEIYRHSARFCIVFISEHYAKKLWTNHERQSAQARAFAESEEYILPARFDDTEVPGIRSTIASINLRTTAPAELAALVVAKLDALPRAAVFIDGDWLLVAAREMAGRLSFEHLLSRLRDAFGENAEVSIHLSDYGGRQSRLRLITQLEDLGYTVDVLTVRGQGGPALGKGFDVSLALRASQLPPHFDPLVLVSGDSDFVPLLERVRESGRTTVVMSFPHALADSLRQAADRFLALDQFLQVNP